MFVTGFAHGIFARRRVAVSLRRAVETVSWVQGVFSGTVRSPWAGQGALGRSRELGRGEGPARPSEPEHRCVISWASTEDCI